MISIEETKSFELINTETKPKTKKNKFDYFDEKEELKSINLKNEVMIEEDKE